MGAIYRFFAEKHGWSAAQVGQLTFAQIDMYFAAAESDAGPNIIQMSPAEARAAGVRGFV